MEAAAHPVLANFPGAVSFTEFIDRQSAWLEAHGWHRGQALAVSASCRDELVACVRVGVRDRWDNAFDLSTLGGLPLAGRTGTRAIRDHAPEDGGTLQIVLFGMSHIGVLADGTPGFYVRHGHTRATTACGSLAAAAAWAADAAADPLGQEFGIDPADPEQSLVRARLHAEDPHFYRLPADAMAVWVAGIIAADLWLHAAENTDPARVDVALVSGVLVHSPGGDWAVPGPVRTRQGGSVEQSGGAFGVVGQ